MKRLLVPIFFILVAIALSSCHSKKSVVIKEQHTADTVYVEKRSESLAQSSFDWRSLGLAFDSLVVVIEPYAPASDVGDSIMRTPPGTDTKATLKVFGGNLSYNDASGEELYAESKRIVETASHQDDKIDDKEDSETQAVAEPVSLGRWIAAIILVLLTGLFLKSRIRRIIG